MSIRKRKLKNGKYSYQAVVERGFDSKGNRLRETKTFATKKEAEAFCNKQLTSIADGTYIEPSKLTVAQALEEWMETEVKPRLAPATTASYEMNVKNHIKPALGTIPLQKLTPTAVQSFYNALDKEKDLSQRSIKYVHDNLHACLKHFVNQQIIPKNVCDFVNVPKKRSAKPKNDFYSLEEAKALLKAVENDRFMPVVYLGLLGLRRSEMLALTWDDIDMVNNIIHINKNLVVVNKQISIGKCKTQASIRSIAIPPSVTHQLFKHKQRQLAIQSVSIGSYHDNNLVICKLNGDYLTPATLSSNFPLMLKKYGLRKIRLHDLRHTYCSLGINYFHIPETVIAKQAGHSSPKITMSIYSHSNMELQKESSAVFEDMLFHEVNKKLG